MVHRNVPYEYAITYFRYDVVDTFFASLVESMRYAANGCAKNVFTHGRPQLVAKDSSKRAPRIVSFLPVIPVNTPSPEGRAESLEEMI